MKKVNLLIITILCITNSYSQGIQGHKDAANTKAANKDYTGAINDYNDIIALDEKNPLNYFQRGSYKYWNNEFENCIADMNLGLKLDQNASLFYLFRAMANIKLNKLETVCDDLAKTNGLGAELKSENCK